MDKTTSPSVLTETPNHKDTPECPVCRNLRSPCPESEGQDELTKAMAQLNMATAVRAESQDNLSPRATQANDQPQYPSMGKYKESARNGCRCCAFVCILYSLSVQLILQYAFTTVNGWGMGATDDDIHALVFPVRGGTLRLRLTNVKWPVPAGRDLDWDVYTLTGAPTRIPFVRETDPIPSMIMHSADTVRKWLKTCRDNHPKCRIKPSGFTPRRLIRIIGQDISTMPCNPLVTPPFQFPDEPTLQLVETDPASPEPIPYAALSYCWGTSRSLWVTTTRHNLPQHRHSIPFTSLPRTISDVILFTRLLGFTHIWVDALCIVQDDVEDWTAEAARMGDVYAAADLVLSANVTGDCTRPTVGFQNFGLAYQICLPLSAGVFAALVPGATGNWDVRRGDPEFPMPERFGKGDMLVLRMAHLHRRIWGANAYRPLDARAWTCQESLLGRRMLTLSNFECAWTCDEWAACECGHTQEVLESQAAAAEKGPGQMWETSVSYRPVQRLRRAVVLGELTDDVPSVETIRSTWRQLVTEYTQRQMAVEGDTLVAISGLARMFGRVLDMIAEKENRPREGRDETSPLYLAGIWSGNLHEGLLWSARRYPQQMAMSLDVSFGGDGGDSQTGASQLPTQRQRDIVNEPHAAMAARMKWFRDRPAKPSKYRAPSWTWASSNFCVSWLVDMAKWDIEMGGDEHTTVATPYLTLIEGHVAAEPDEYGAVAAGFITVKGPLVRVRCRSVPLSPQARETLALLNVRSSPLADATTAKSQDAAAGFMKQTVAQANHGFVRAECGLVFQYFPDDEPEAGPVAHDGVYNCLFDGWGKACAEEGCDCKRGWSDDIFWCLRVRQVVVRGESGKSHTDEGWLVLKRSEEDDAFVRVGVGHFGEETEFRLFEDAEETVVRII